MEIGDIVFHQEYGVGQIEDIDKTLLMMHFEEPLFQYLVYYYKENPLLHNGSIGPNFHYWWSYAEDLKLISSVRTLIERRQHG